MMPAINEKVFPKKLIQFALRFVGLLIMITGILMRNMNLLGKIVFILIGLTILIFTEAVYKAFFISNSREQQIVGRFLSVAIILMGIFILFH